MKYINQTFDEFLSDICDCHTNNSPEGFENWLEQLDTQEIMDYAQAYGELQYEAGMQEAIKNLTPVEDKTI